MTTPPDETPTPCAATAVIRAVRGRWAPAIVATLAAAGPTGFLALGRALPGISKKVLAEELRRLREAGVVDATPAPAGGQEVFYALTERGEALKAGLDGLADLSARWPSLDPLP